MAALLDAVQRGDIEAVREALAGTPAAAAERDEKGTSAVLHAAYRRRGDLVALLRPHLGPLDALEAAALGDDRRLGEILTADPGRATARAGDGFFPLALACFFGHPASVTLLLAAGADVHQRADNPQQVQAIHAAVAAACPEAVQALIGAGADVDARQQAGVTPLMGAAAAGSAELVELLLAAGADPTLADDAGLTAAGWATRRGHPDLARRLTP